MFPDFLYYSQSQSRLSLTETPGGSFVPEELLRGNKKCWMNSTTESIVSNKKIIIADWRARGWDIGFRYTIVQLLEKMLQDGFEIFVYNVNQLIPFEKEDLLTIQDLLHPIYFSPVESPEVITAFAMDALGLNSDHLQVLDPFWLDALLSGKDRIEKINLSYTDITLLGNDDQRKLVDIIKNAPYPLESIIINVYNSDFEYKLESFILAFPTVPVVNEYKTYQIYHSDLVQLIQNREFTNKIGTLKLEQIYQAAEVEVLEDICKYRITPNDSKVIFNSIMSNAISVNLGPINEIYLPEHFVAAQYQNIQILRIEDLDFNMIQLQAIVQSMPNLKELTLVNCFISENDSIFNGPKLNELRVIKLLNVKTPIEVIEKILNIAPNLNMIEVECISDENSREIKIEAGAATKLTTIKLVYGEITLNNLTAILNAATNLYTLEVDQALIKDISNVEIKKMSNLRNFILRTLYIHPKIIYALLSVMPELKILCLNAIELSNINEDIGPISLPKLQQLELNDLNWPSQCLNRLLSTSKKLQSIKLIALTLEDKLDFAEIDFSSLRHFTCIDVDYFTMDNLRLLLSKAQAIETICFKNIEMDEETLSIPSQSLQHLKVLRLESVYIEPSALQILLLSAKRLQKLIFKCVNVNIDPLEIPDSIASSVEEFTSDNCYDLTRDEVSTMISEFTHLKKICLSNLKMLSTEDACALLEEFPSIIIEVDVPLVTHTGHQVTTVEQASPAFDVSAYIDLKPSNTIAFEYTYVSNENNLHQNRFIHQLSRYLQLTEKNSAYIPKLQDGICIALSTLFFDLSIEKWNQFTIEVVAWNGKEQSLTDELKLHFELLLQYVLTHQLNQQGKEQFLGEGLESYLQQATQPGILNNPWHSISIKPVASRPSWIIYDPNSSIGYIEVQASELVSKIRFILGDMVSVMSKQNLRPIMSNANNFIAQGGLVTIAKYNNRRQVLDLIPLIKDYDLETLNGLLLRNNGGYPAWVSCLENSDACIQVLGLNLLAQFIEKYEDATQALQKSIECMDEESKIECLSIIGALYKRTAFDIKHVRVLDCIFNILQDTPEEIDFDVSLQTWRKNKRMENSSLEYVRQCINDTTVRTRLIELHSASDLLGMYCSLESYCLSTKQAYKYIGSASELVCSAPYLKRIGNQGLVQKGPGGDLFDFINTRHTNDPILIFNIDNFSNEEIARLLSLLDNKGSVDGVKIPNKMKIIALRTKTKPNVYNGADLLSRFDLVEQAQVASGQLMQQIPKLPFVQTTTKKTISINFFHTTNWEATLLGHWTLFKDKLVFREGELVSALKQSHCIQIINGPWFDKKFTFFWQQALVRGYIEYAGRTIKIPNNLQIARIEGYDWSLYQPLIKLNENSNSKLHILNPGTLNTFLTDFVCDNKTQTIEPTLGLIAQLRIAANNASKKRKVTTELLSLPVYLTRILSLDQWAMVLEQCKQYKVELLVQCAPGVTLPGSLGISIPEDVTPKQIEPGKDKFFYSEDIDVAVKELTQNATWQVIDVSECAVGDLLKRFNGCLDEQSLRFKFIQTNSAVLELLSKGQNVLLKGYFSQELADHLASFIMDRIQLGDKASGSLVLVVENKECFNYIPLTTFAVTTQLKKKHLGEMNKRVESALAPLMESESFVKLKARCDYMQHHPEATEANDAWQGIYSIKNQVRKLPEFQLQSVARITSEFTQNRLDAVNKVLSYAPFVFLTGLSGVGKSTFVLKELSKTCTLYSGSQQLKQWALDATGGRKILFIDEANLEHSDFTQFEGLYNQQSSILIEGTLYYLSTDHKLVFAGNPMSYGGERTLAKFFAQHGNAILFEPIPTEVIYQEILLPVFENSSLKTSAPQICSYFLEVYRFLLFCSEDDVLITPRELQMMAILTVAIASYKTSFSPINIAQYYTNLLVTGLVPDKYQTLYKQQFNFAVARATKEPTEKNGFVFTHSRYLIQVTLNDLLYVRTLRQTEGKTEAFCYGGLGGLIVEGDQGIGKCDLLLNALSQRGMSEVTGDNTPANENQFYRIRASMPMTLQVKILCKAADEGAIVLMDKVNSGPTMEKLQNDLLMGMIPNQGRPTKPGFLLLGGQTPSTQAGKKKLSTAFARRVMTFKLPEYDKEEMLTITQKKGMTPIQSNSLVHAYLRNKAKAVAEHLHPSPCFRDVIKLVQRISSGNRRRREHALTVRSAQQKTTRFFSKSAPSDTHPQSGKKPSIRKPSSVK